MLLCNVINYSLWHYNFIQYGIQKNVKKNTSKSKLKMKKQPLVSIIITSYNRANMIGKAIESALIQDYPNLEIIVSDNCSSDNTDAVIRQYMIDDRIKYNINKENIGMNRNFKKAFFELSSGEYILNISSDDYLSDNRLVSDAVSLINKYDNLSFVTAKYVLLNEENKKITEPPMPISYEDEYLKGTDFFKTLSSGSALGWTAVVMRKSYLDHNLFDNENSTAQDQISNLRMALKGDIGLINRNSYVFRQHQNNSYNYTHLTRYMENLVLYDEVINYAKKQQTSISNECFDNILNKVLSINIKKYLVQLFLENPTDFKSQLSNLKDKYPDTLKGLMSNKIFKFRLYCMKYFPLPSKIVIKLYAFISVIYHKLYTQRQ